VLIGMVYVLLPYMVLTLFAAMSFDPRLIWDAAERADGRDTARA
jgi:ABC-type spermidine/putrescine transport system permease subunit I